MRDTTLSFELDMVANVALRLEQGVRLVFLKNRLGGNLEEFVERFLVGALDEAIDDHTRSVLCSINQRICLSIARAKSRCQLNPSSSYNCVMYL